MIRTHLPVMAVCVILSGCAFQQGCSAPAYNDSMSRSVWIDTESPSKGEKGTCSGFVFQTGVIITAAHCVGESMHADGQSATLLAVSASDDLALLEAPTTRQNPLELDLAPQQGMKVYVAGNYLTFKHLLSIGNIVGVTRGEIFSSVMAAPGFSGSGLFDENGRLVGVNTQMRGHYIDGSAVVLFASSVPAERVRILLALNQNRIDAATRSQGV